MECSFLSSHSIFLMYPYRNTLEIRPVSGRDGAQSPPSTRLGKEILPWPETQNASQLLFLLLWKGLQSRESISFNSLGPNLSESICPNSVEAEVAFRKTPRQNLPVGAVGNFNRFGPKFGWELRDQNSLYFQLWGFYHPRGYWVRCFWKINVLDSK